MWHETTGKVKIDGNEGIDRWETVGNKKEQKRKGWEGEGQREGGVSEVKKTDEGDRRTEARWD